MTAWSSNSNGSGSLTVTTGSALAGTYGLQALVNSTATRYVQDTIPYQEPRYRSRFYFDPNSSLMAENDAFFLLYGYSGSTVVLRLELMYTASPGYRLRPSALNTGTSWTYGAWQSISDVPHAIEFDWQSGTSGRIDWWIDGTPQAPVTGFDNSSRRIDEVRLGTVAGLDPGTSGTFFFDAFESRRYTYIGSGTSLPDPIFADGFESGAFGYWSAYTGVAVSTEAALVPGGTKGMSVPIVLGTSTAKYVTDNVPGVEPRYRARFYFDPNTITMSDNTDLVLFYGDSGTTPVLELDLGFLAASGFRLRTRIRDNANVWNNSAWVNIPDAPHILELDWQSGAPGSLAWWIDEAPQPAPNTITNSDRRIDRIRMGAAANVDKTTSGTMYLDAFESRRQTYIGPVGWVPPPVLSVWTQYYYAGGRRIAMRIREGARNDLYYLLTDHLGSTALTVGPTGIVLGEMRYTAWGEPRYAWGSTPTDHRYTGQRQDADTGLYYYRARWYDPQLGRFAQADTIVAGAGNPMAWDRFVYGLGNPVKYSDPTGHWADEGCGYGSVCNLPVANDGGGDGDGFKDNGLPLSADATYASVTFTISLGHFYYWVGGVDIVRWRNEIGIFGSKRAMNSTSELALMQTMKTKVLPPVSPQVGLSGIRGLLWGERFNREGVAAYAGPFTYVGGTSLMVTGEGFVANDPETGSLDPSVVGVGTGLSAGIPDPGEYHAYVTESFLVLPPIVLPAWFASLLLPPP